ncbi:MAG: caspase family protein [Gammaproteobacteria bacterium]|nr:caspase family protein [Gammaproteobacteria bacterium]
MKIKSYLFLILSLASVVDVQAAEQMQINRYAIISGSNEGGKDRLSLKYAQSDARLIAGVFAELGGLDKSQSTLLLEPTPDELLNTIRSINNKMALNSQKDIRNEFIFYYSGHSDENGLLLGEQKLEYKHLREAVKDLNADVKVAILDSCASGAFTRIKGGKRRPTFLVDESSKVKGHAFLASSSAEESAQESDIIRGSYFTHYLVSALRGAGDTTNDKRVTLNEAYQFAFHETLARTENSLFGAQHAAYDIQLAGAGDLVLTDLHNANASLVLPKAMSGRLYIRNSEGNLIVELNKIAERPMQLAMEPGRYSVIIDKAGTLLKTEFVLEKDDTFVLDEKVARRIESEDAVARGDISPKHKEDEYADIDLKVSLFPDFEYRSHVTNGKKEKVKLDLNLFAGQTDSLYGLGLGVFISYIREDTRGVQVSSFVNYTGGNFSGYRGTGLGNISRYNFKGGQGAGLFNYVGGNAEGGMGVGGFNLFKGDLKGGAGAGVANIFLGDVKGGAGSGVTNLVHGDLKGGVGTGVVNIIKGDVEGGVGSGVVNILGGSLKGGMGTGVVNIVEGNVRGGVGSGITNIVGGNLHGGIGTAIVNVVKGDLKGGAGSGVANIVGGDVDGVMGAGVVNIVGGKLNGVQVSGWVNIARSGDGYQLGVVNLANEFDGVPVGMLSLYRNGRKDLDFSFDELSYGNITFKSGTPSIYNMVGVGFKDKSGELHDVRMHWGVGKHVTLSQRAYLDVDVLFSSSVRKHNLEIEGFDYFNNKKYTGYCTFCWNSNNSLALRLAAGTKMSRFLKLFGGVSANLLYDKNQNKVLEPGIVKATHFDYLGKSFQVWPGLYAGLEF